MCLARRVLEESEEQASHFRSATADELEQARQTIRLLEQGQGGSGAPSFTPNLTPQIGRCTSQLTLGQPVPALPASNTRAPWAATRERLQHQASVPSTPLLQPQGLGSVSSGLPSLSGVGSGKVCVVCSLKIPLASLRPLVSDGVPVLVDHVNMLPSLLPALSAIASFC